MSNWEDKVRKVVPYVPGEQPKIDGIIKLNTNENPYPPSKLVEKAIREYGYESGRLYPDPTCSELVEALADYYKVDKNQVFVGVGSDDVIAMSFMTFFNSDKPIYFPDVTYSFYDVWADEFKIPYLQMKLTEDFRIDPKDYIGKDLGGIIFPNPNAPTGVYEDLSLIEEIVSANRDVVVIIDEAYIDFGGESALELTKKYDNLLVVQTYSKSRSMAGHRIGFAIGNPKLIKYLNDVKFSFNSYTMDRITLKLGTASLKDDAYFKDGIKRIINTRENAKTELKKLGFSFPDSMTNFIFATHKDKKASYIFEELKKRKIFVRYFNKDRIDNYLRITIGTDEEMAKLFKALEEIVK